MPRAERQGTSRTYISRHQCYDPEWKREERCTAVNEFCAGLLVTYSVEEIWFIDYQIKREHFRAEGRAKDLKRWPTPGTHNFDLE
jgi:hypothetical protein